MLDIMCIGELKRGRLRGCSLDDCDDISMYTFYSTCVDFQAYLVHKWRWVLETTTVVDSLIVDFANKNRL